MRFWVQKNTYDFPSVSNGGSAFYISSSGIGTTYTTSSDCSYGTEYLLAAARENIFDPTTYVTGEWEP